MRQSWYGSTSRYESRRIRYWNFYRLSIRWPASSGASASLWLAGVIGLTYVEFGIKEPEPTLYTVMFVSVLVMNTAFAIDVYREVKA